MSSKEGFVSSHLERQDQFVNLENCQDCEVARFESRSSRPTRPIQHSHSHSRSQSHLSSETVSLRREMDHLRRQIRQNQRNRWSRSLTMSSAYSSELEWRRCRRSGTPPSETEIDSFEGLHRERQHCRRHGPIPRRNRDREAMSKALSQISKSPFTRQIKRTKLPKRFAQPIFIVYNGRTDPIEHVSHFN